MGFFKCSVTGLGTIDKDISKASEKISLLFNPILQNVGSEMTELLQNHIKHDWYEQYSPLHYFRRTDMGLTTAIGSDRQMEYSTNENTLFFKYEPLGNPTEGTNRANGNRLIRIIQNASGGGWVGIPERPYWNNFVEDLENGTLMDLISRASTKEKIYVGQNEFVDLSEYKL